MADDDISRLYGRTQNSFLTGLASAGPSGLAALGSPLGFPYVPPPSPLAGLNAFTQSPVGSLLGGYAEAYRRRSGWNDRFAHWERSESTSETRRIERARDMVKSTLDYAPWITSQGVSIIPQGSFSNRTNTRLEADIDLRAHHPAIKVDYSPLVDRNLAYAAGGYVSLGVDFTILFQNFRRELLARLFAGFDKDDVSPGNKAIRVKGLTGSRSEVDVVPAVTLHYITGHSILGGISKIEGVAILATDGTWTYNFPDQHLANGRAKTERTNRQFKRVVRILKRLRADMEERGVLTKRPPSFLIECLAYLADDHYFTVAEDDRVDRVKRVLNRVAEKLAAPSAQTSLREINDVKALFGSHQGWTYNDTVHFVDLANIHIGAN